MNGDGRADFVFGDPLQEVGGESNVGMVQVWSWPSGQIRAWTGEDQTDRFGHAVDVADVN